MTLEYSTVPKSEIDAKAGLEGFDALGLATYCSHHESGLPLICAPVPELEIGDPDEVIIEHEDSVDPTDDYPGAVVLGGVAGFRTYAHDADKHYFHEGEIS